MSCGLGAVILMFLLVKKNAQKEIIETPQANSISDMAVLKQEENFLTNENNKLRNTKIKLTKQEKKLKLRSKDYDSILNVQKEKEKSSNVKINELENEIKKIDIENNDDKLELQGEGQQEYLIGLEIKGKKVLILLDTSASMTDEKLIDIIKRKTKSKKNIIKGPKWQRAKRIVKWLLVRLPDESKVAVIKFSNDAKLLGKKSWHDNNSKNLTRLYSEINKIVPGNSTNLDSAFTTIKKMNIKPDEIFLITDGLPTSGNKASSNSFFSNCNSIIGKAKKISGDCREKLFLSSINNAKNIISNIKINIILLPLEGDPAASSNFWKLATKKQGLLFVPSKDWP